MAILENLLEKLSPEKITAITRHYDEVLAQEMLQHGQITRNNFLDTIVEYQRKLCPFSSSQGMDALQIVQKIYKDRDQLSYFQDEKGLYLEQAVEDALNGKMHDIMKAMTELAKEEAKLSYINNQLRSAAFSFDQKVELVRELFAKFNKPSDFPSYIDRNIPEKHAYDYKWLVMYSLTRNTPTRDVEDQINR
jgi:hypothetical protein